MCHIIDEALSLIEVDDPLYDIIIDSDYEYLIKYCKNGQEYINIIKKEKEMMKQIFFVNALFHEIYAVKKKN